MRRTMIGLAAIGLLAATGCSDGDGGGSASGGGSTEEFCESYKDLEDELNDVDSNDPAAVAEATERLDDLEPPDEIADEFQAVVDFTKDAAAAAEDVDLTDPDAAAELQEQFEGRQAELEEAGQKVDDFLADKCGIEDGA